MTLSSCVGFDLKRISTGGIGRKPNATCSQWHLRLQCNLLLGPITPPPLANFPQISVPDKHFLRSPKSRSQAGEINFQPTLQGT